MEKIREWISSLRKTLFDLYEYYKNIIGKNRPFASTLARGSSSSSSSLTDDTLQMFKNRRMQTKFIFFNSELQRYFDQPILDIEDNNFLIF